MQTRGQLLSVDPGLSAGIVIFLGGVNNTTSPISITGPLFQSIFQMLADAGILGFACVAAFVFLLVRKGIKSVAGQTDDLKRSVVTGALAGCFGILIHSFFDFPLRTTANAFVFLMLAALASGTYARSKRSRSG